MWSHGKRSSERSRKAGGALCRRRLSDQISPSPGIGAGLGGQAWKPFGIVHGLLGTVVCVEEKDGAGHWETGRREQCVCLEAPSVYLDRAKINMTNLQSFANGSLEQRATTTGEDADLGKELRSNRKKTVGPRII